VGVDVFGHTLSFMPDNFLDESLVNFLFGEERDAGVSCIMWAVSVIDRFFFCFINDKFPETELKHQRNPVGIIIIPVSCLIMRLAYLGLFSVTKTEERKGDAERHCIVRRGSSTGKEMQ